MTSSFRAFSAVLVLLFIAGCGQSGPLFVPGDPSTVQPQQPQPTDQEEDDEEDGSSTSQ